MKHMKNVLEFLQDNAIMIDSLMSKKESELFDGSVVSILENDIKMQIAVNDARNLMKHELRK